MKDWIYVIAVEMRYKPERALTLSLHGFDYRSIYRVEMRYKPERALTPYDIRGFHFSMYSHPSSACPWQKNIKFIKVL